MIRRGSLCLLVTAGTDAFGAGDLVEKMKSSLFLPLECTGVGQMRQDRAFRLADAVLMEAEALRALGQADELRRCLDQPAWREMLTARSVYRLWLARGEAGERASLAAEVVSNARAEPEARIFTALLLDSWGFAREAAGIWMLIAASDDELGCLARARVTSLAIETKDTGLLLQLYKELLAGGKVDADARIKHLYLVLLLGENQPGILGEAMALHAAVPANSAVAAVCAFGLYRSGRTDEALQKLAGLEPAALLGRPESLIAALVLERTDPRRARALAISARTTLRLPEEKALLAEVLRRLPGESIRRRVE